MNTQKYRLIRGNHSRIEDGKRVRKNKGDIFVPRDRELERFPWKFELVVEERDADNDDSNEKNNDSGSANSNDNNNDSADNTNPEDPGAQAEADNLKPPAEEQPPPKEEPANNSSDEETNIDITELSTREAGPVISECKETDQLKAWQVQEEKGENRSTILKALESRINALEEGE